MDDRIRNSCLQTSTAAPSTAVRPTTAVAVPARSATTAPPTTTTSSATSTTPSNTTNSNKKLKEELQEIENFLSKYSQETQIEVTKKIMAKHLLGNHKLEVRNPGNSHLHTFWLFPQMKNRLRSYPLDLLDFFLLSGK